MKDSVKLFLAVVFEGNEPEISSYLTPTHSLFQTHTVPPFITHPLSQTYTFFLSLSNTHPFSLSLSLSLSPHTHTHIIRSYCVRNSMTRMRLRGVRCLGRQHAFVISFIFLEPASQLFIPNPRRTSLRDLVTDGTARMTYFSVFFQHFFSTV